MASIAALLLLLRRVTRRRPSDDLYAEAERLQRQLAEAYLIGRAAAARTATARLVAELEALAGIAQPLTWHPLVIEEARRAERAARGYSQSWLSRALGLAEDEVSAPGTVAHARLRRQLEVGARTEASTAFHEARRDAISEAVASNPELSDTFEQVWNVAWCKGTCDECAALDGMVRPLGEDFPHGDPPLHPWCGCEIDTRLRS
jgi:hypothetical protein